MSKILEYVEKNYLQKLYDYHGDDYWWPLKIDTIIKEHKEKH